MVSGRNGFRRERLRSQAGNLGDVRGEQCPSNMYVRQVALRSYGFGMRWNTEQEDAGDLLGNRYSGPGKARLSRKDPTETRPDILPSGADNCPHIW
jgi:hypothetical protein